MLSLSSRHPFNYGIYATELYSAFSPDISIIALMNGNYNDDFYDEFGKLCRFKYNIDASAYFVSRYVSLSASMYRRNFRMHIQVKYKIYQKNTQYFQIVI